MVYWLFELEDDFKWKKFELQSCRTRQKLQFSYKFHFHLSSYQKVIKEDVPADTWNNGTIATAVVNGGTAPYHRFRLKWQLEAIFSNLEICRIFLKNCWKENIFLKNQSFYFCFHFQNFKSKFNTNLNILVIYKSDPLIWTQISIYYTLIKYFK
jgi:hypothetical protein